MSWGLFRITLVLALLALLAVGTSSWAATRSGDFKGPIGLQLYTLRESFKTDVPLGTGQVNWPAVLKQAAAVGVKHYFIEDESVAPLESLPLSVKYLQGVKF